MHLEGIIIAISTFLIIGVFHPIVIKTEYHFGTRPWWIFLIIGVASVLGALTIENVLWSALLGVFGASSLWTIGELFEQRKRVERGWFPKKPQKPEKPETKK